MGSSAAITLNGNTLLHQKSGQMDNNLAEQQVNSNNKVKTKRKHKNNSLHHYPKF